MTASSQSQDYPLPTAELAFLLSASGVLKRQNAYLLGQRTPRTIARAVAPLRRTARSLLDDVANPDRSAALNEFSSSITLDAIYRSIEDDLIKLLGAIDMLAIICQTALKTTGPAGGSAEVSISAAGVMLEHRTCVFKQADRLAKEILRRHRGTIERCRRFQEIDSLHV